MHLTDYEPTAAAIDDTPRPNASQVVAAAKRAQPPLDDAPLPTRQPIAQQQLIVGIVGVLAVIGVLALALSGHSAPTPLQLEPPPAQAFDTGAKSSPTASPAATTAPTATIPPTSPPVPTEAALAVPVESAQTGRGLTLALAVATPTDVPIEATPAPEYIANVGAQAPHSPRGDGQAGQVGGDWVVVPTTSDLQRAIIGAQAPHKVR